jgi:hypothetical protein
MYVSRVAERRFVKIKYIYYVAFFALAAAAFGAENVVLNTGFESGEMSPWVATDMVVSAKGAHAGAYGAYFYAEIGCDGFEGCSRYDAGQVVWGDIKQDFGREITPAELRGVDFWVYYAPDVEGNPWRLDAALGPNEYIWSSSRGELKKGWNHIWIPVERVTRPFSFAYVKPSLETG